MSHSDMSFHATDLQSMPGHGIRRLQQIAVALFTREMGEFGVTPVQFAVLQALQAQPGIDQKTLADTVSFDTSTIGAVIDRLEAKALLTRSLSPEDRRVRLLNLTPAGSALLAQALPAVQRTQARILAPLDAQEQQHFCALLSKLCNGLRVDG